MSGAINDGGPAFPEPAVFDANRGEVNPATAYGFAAGMTLRDYFAIHAGDFDVQSALEDLGRNCSDYPLFSNGNGR